METLACPSQSCTFAISASCESAFVAAVALNECTAQPDHFSIDAGCPAILLDNIAVDRTRLQMLIQCACAVVFHGAEEGTVQHGTVGSVLNLRWWKENAPTPFPPKEPTKGVFGVRALSDLVDCSGAILGGYAER